MLDRNATLKLTLTLCAITIVLASAFLPGTFV